MTAIVGGFNLTAKSSWGVAAMCTGAVRNFTQLIVCRCLLGLFEAAFGCGAPYFLSLFYQRRELGFRLSLLLGMSPVANCFASALAYGISQIKGSLEPWRYMFIIGTKSHFLLRSILTLISLRGITDDPVCACCLFSTSRLPRHCQVSF